MKKKMKGASWLAFAKRDYTGFRHVSGAQGSAIGEQQHLGSFLSTALFMKPAY